MIAAFTGTRRGMTPAQQHSVATLLRDLQISNLLHGACEGADREVHDLAKGLLREMYPSNAEQFVWGAAHIGPGDVVHSVPLPSVKPNAQIWRNHRMVDRASVLIAAPAQALEVQRSGTWATIRYAGTVMVPCFRCLPDGTVIAPEEA